MAAAHPRGEGLLLRHRVLPVPRRVAISVVVVAPAAAVGWEAAARVARVPLLLPLLALEPVRGVVRGRPDVPALPPLSLAPLRLLPRRRFWVLGAALRGVFRVQGILLVVRHPVGEPAPARGVDTRVVPAGVPAPALLQLPNLLPLLLRRRH